MNSSAFLEAREIARHCMSIRCAKMLRETIDAAAAADRAFEDTKSRRDMQTLVAAWTRMLLAMDACGPYLPKPPNPRKSALAA